MPDEPAPTDDLSLSPPSSEPSPPASSPPRLLLSQSALCAIRDHGYSDTSHECGGVMVGEKLDGGRGPVVLVEAVIAGAHTDSRRGSVTFTHDTWEHINQEKDQKYSDLRIVGWYHTHPGFGIFLSDYDEFIQANFFNLPWNIAFVLDPLSGEAGAFGWVKGKITRLPQYESYAVAEEHPAKTRVAQAAEPVSEVAPAPELPPEAPRAVPWLRSPLRWGAVLLALILLLALGLTGAWMLGTKLAIARHRAQVTPPPLTAPPTTGETPVVPETPATGETPAGPETSATAETPVTPPPTEATPAPPVSTGTASAPAKEPPHEPGESTKSGP